LDQVELSGRLGLAYRLVFVRCEGGKLTWSSSAHPRTARSAPRIQNSKESDWARRNSVSRTSDGESFAIRGVKCSRGIGLFVVFAARNIHVGLVLYQHLASQRV
jgi:hypothetical protein